VTKAKLSRRAFPTGHVYHRGCLPHDRVLLRPFLTCPLPAQQLLYVARPLTVYAAPVPLALVQIFNGLQEYNNLLDCLQLAAGNYAEGRHLHFQNPPSKGPVKMKAGQARGDRPVIVHLSCEKTCKAKDAVQVRVLSAD
jgi:hypothetical protein